MRSGFDIGVRVAGGRHFAVVMGRLSIGALAQQRLVWMFSFGRAHVALPVDQVTALRIDLQARRSMVVVRGMLAVLVTGSLVAL
jgi:hypothetical protein